MEDSIGIRNINVPPNSMDLRLQKIVLNELKRGDFDYIDKFMKEKGLREGIGLKPLFALFLGEYKFRCMRKKDENKN